MNCIIPTRYMISSFPNFVRTKIHDMILLIFFADTHVQMHQRTRGAAVGHARTRIYDENNIKHTYACGSSFP